MGGAEEQNNFLEIYKDYVTNILTPTKNEIKTILRKWKDSDSWRQHTDELVSPTPINWVAIRIKRPESLVDKILAQTKTFPEGLVYNSLRIVNDTVAGRIIVYCLSDLKLIHETIINCKEFDVSTQNPPAVFLEDKFIRKLGFDELEIRGKDTGYCAIHYILRLKKTIVPDGKRPWFEIQVKTLAQHAWSEIEHILGYKPSCSQSATRQKQFKIISAHLNAIDEHFDLLFEEVLSNQQEVIYKPQSIITPENLPKLLNDKGIKCAQDEIDKLLKILNSRGVNYVGDFEEVASGNRLKIIKDTYKNLTKNEPDNSEIVANLAAIKGITDDSYISEAVRTQINFKEIWDELNAE